jgi:predicted oxidoreductase (fatty acid repression mutant protein)
VQSSAAADRAAKERQLRLQRWMTYGALAAALLMAIIGGFAWFQWDEAERAKLLAQRAEARAENELMVLQTTQSRLLAGAARQQRTAGDAGTAILLSLEALPDSKAGITRPYVREPELQLDGAWRDLRERLVLKGHTDVVYSAAFSPDGKRIVTASRDKTARLWDAETGKPIGEPLTGHAQSVWSAAFSPDSKRIVTASGDKTARLWDAATGKPIGEPLTGHADAVYSAAFSPDGKRIVTASGDKTARLWDAESGNPMGEFVGHEDRVSSAAFSPDGKRIVTASFDKTARLWDVFADTQELVSHAKAAIPRCLTAAQRSQFFLPPEPPMWCIELKKWPYHTDAWKHWLSDTRAGKNTPLPAAE